MPSSALIDCNANTITKFVHAPILRCNCNNNDQQSRRVRNNRTYSRYSYAYTSSSARLHVDINCLSEDKLSFVIVDEGKQLPFSDDINLYFTTDDSFIYSALKDDVGPLNLGYVYKYCDLLSARLDVCILQLCLYVILRVIRILPTFIKSFITLLMDLRRKELILHF